MSAVDGLSRFPRCEILQIWDLGTNSTWSLGAQGSSKERWLSVILPLCAELPGGPGRCHGHGHGLLLPVDSLGRPRESLRATGRPVPAALHPSPGTAYAVCLMFLSFVVLLPFPLLLMSPTRSAV